MVGERGAWGYNWYSSNCTDYFTISSNGWDTITVTAVKNIKVHIVDKGRYSSGGDVYTFTDSDYTLDAGEHVTVTQTTSTYTRLMFICYLLEG